MSHGYLTGFCRFTVSTTGPFLPTISPYTASPRTVSAVLSPPDCLLASSRRSLNEGRRYLQIDVTSSSRHTKFLTMEGSK